MLTPRPAYRVLVISAMRTGSTWLTGLFERLLQCQLKFVENVPGLSAALAAPGSVVLKAHDLIDLDWPAVPEEVRMVRILRNYKDSLISRVLYNRHIRPQENALILEDEVREFVARHAELDDVPFVNKFLQESSVMHQWLEAIVVMERGEDDRVATVLYEAFLHNPHDAFDELVHHLWPNSGFAPAMLKSLMWNSLKEGRAQREHFLRAKAVGVGGWETCLSWELAHQIDQLYFTYRERCGLAPLKRFPITC